MVKECGFCLKRNGGALQQDDSSLFLLLFALIGKTKEYSELTELISEAFSKSRALYFFREIKCQDSVKILCSGLPSLATYFFPPFLERASFEPAV